jgi:uncharacterized phiE125 gp8 family phage protein
MTTGYFNNPEVIGGSGLWSVRVTTAPVLEPVTSTEAKAHLRIDGADDDTYVASLIVAAREYCEAVTRRAFITQTCKMYLRQAPTTDVIELPKPNLLSVVGITYYDQNDASQTFSSASYRAVTTDLIGSVKLKDGYAWPSVREDRHDAITIEYTAGYGTLQSTVPTSIKQAMLLIIGHWYRSRESVLIGLTSKELEFTTERLLSPYQVPTF